MIGCVIPCYKAGKIILDIVEKALNYVDFVVIVDDKCPFNSGHLINKEFNDKRVDVIFNEKNLGVGGAVKIGFNYLIQKNCKFIIKIDADGQMDPSLIPKILAPLVNGEADAVKGNRFTSLDNILLMPFIRIIGNLGLSFLNKISTGYWELFDPTNGFIAFKLSTLKQVRLDKVDNRFFFESDLLFQCSLSNIYFSQIAMKSKYGAEISSLKPIKEIFRFATKHLQNFFKRIIYQYLILDFNIGTLEIIGFFISSSLLLSKSFKVLSNGILENKLASPGEANFISIFAIISIQLLISFFYFDSTQKPLFRKLDSLRRRK